MTEFEPTAKPYTHHFGRLTVLSVGVFAAVDVLRPAMRRAALRAAAAVGAALLLYVPGALFIFARQAGSYHSDASNLVPPRVFLQVFTYANYAPPPYTTILTVFSLAAFLFGLFVLVRRSGSTLTGVALGLAILVAVAAMLVAYWAGIRLLPRYLLHVAALVFLVMAATLTADGKGLLRTVALSIGGLTVLLYAVYGFGFARNVPNEAATAHWKADWRGISHQIERERLAGEPVVITSWDATPVQYYLGEEALTPDDVVRQLGATSAPHDSYLLVITPHTRSLELYEDARLVYENEAEGIRLQRLQAP